MHICEEENCKNPSEEVLEYMSNGEFLVTKHCMRHYYENHYKIYKKCCVDPCRDKVYKQFLTPPQSANDPALGPYLCKQHYFELRLTCIVQDCNELAMVGKEVEIEGEAAILNLCEEHAKSENEF